ncbi:MAG: outer membrane beta-barrel protein, partial [Deltaproteobacteria bacterium]|nr:outer membrane beta-barrel protein [Deltaproteobacteria bacterium]
MKKMMFFVVMFLTIGIVGTGLCQIRPGAFSVTPTVGGYMFEGNQDLDQNPVYGLRLGYDFTNRVGAELVLGYDRTLYAEFIPDVKTNVFNFRVEGLYHFMPDKRLVPFIAAGIGGQYIDYLHKHGSDTKFVADYGVGLKYFITKSIALRGDVRHVLAAGSLYNNL